MSIRENLEKKDNEELKEIYKENNEISGGGKL